MKHYSSVLFLHSFVDILCCVVLVLLEHTRELFPSICINCTGTCVLRGSGRWYTMQHNTYYYKMNKQVGRMQTILK